MTGSASSVSRRILVVEDLEHNRELFRAVLTRAGHEVDTAPNGQDAIAAVQARRYDLVLMDIQMPVMDGLAATRAIRALPEPASDVPIIGMSANVLPEQLLAFEAAGMDDHLGKPFRREQLLQKVTPWLQRSVAAEQTVGVGSGTTPVEAGLQEALELMGPDWVRGGLERLKRQIDEAFGTPRPEPALLARQAHALVAHASLLGFRALSEQCSRLENACLSGRGSEEAYAAARTQAEAVRRAADDLLRTLVSAG